jgi:hypothetical protein
MEGHNRPCRGGGDEADVGGGRWPEAEGRSRKGRMGKEEGRSRESSRGRAGFIVRCRLEHMGRAPNPIRGGKPQTVVPVFSTLFLSVGLTASFALSHARTRPCCSLSSATLV